ncbi:Uma2 family endonuclease [Streptomyces bauhiniae]
MVAPAWMHTQISAEQYDSWSEEQCAGIEILSPGSETTDRIVKVDQYAKAGIPFYWRVEQAATGVPIVYTYVLDPATKAYRDGEMFTGTVKATAPFPVAVDLGII